MVRHLRRLLGLAAALVLMPAGASAQEAATITGTVRSDAGQPLQLATVFVEGLGIGTTTRENGEYTLPYHDRLLGDGPKVEVSPDLRQQLAGIGEDQHAADQCQQLGELIERQRQAQCDQAKACAQRDRFYRVDDSARRIPGGIAYASRLRGYLSLIEFVRLTTSSLGFNGPGWRGVY